MKAKSLKFAHYNATMSARDNAHMTRSQTRADASTSISTTATAQTSTLNPAMGKPVYFWREYDSSYDFLSQWYPSPFLAPGSSSSSGDEEKGEQVTFATTEQWMMYQKAMLFGDGGIAERILREPTPKGQKALGRKVKGFDGTKWDEEKEGIVEEGNWWKFTAAKGKGDELRKKLLATGNKELVEASPYDRIWGIGFSAANADANREAWGENLLGKALMRVRERLKADADKVGAEKD